jgi:hypothetical protein
VWVVAETTDLPTRYIKEVVTDDRGRYLIPDLPKAKYTVWARGYGLVDSPKVQTEPGEPVDLKPNVAPDAKTAARYYPADYWYALLEVPAKTEFPGTDAAGNGISSNVKNQGQWIHLIKTDSCESCHQLGNLYTRTIPAMFDDLDPAQAWLRRLQSGTVCLNSATNEPPSCLVIGLLGSRTASFPRRRLRDPRASSVTW